jgi:hypothetical protein
VWTNSDVDNTIVIGTNNVGIFGVRYIGGVGAFTVNTGYTYHYIDDARL